MTTTAIDAMPAPAAAGLDQMPHDPLDISADLAESIFDYDANGMSGTSGWRTVSQRRIDQFAQSTDDTQFIHVDPERAALETPFGGTIAHGLLTLSLVSTLASDVIRKDAMTSIMIVGIDRVKFLTPLHAGGRVRGVFRLKTARPMGDDRIMLVVAAKIEIDGSPRPALTCDVAWIAQMAKPPIDAFFDGPSDS